MGLYSIICWLGIASCVVAPAKTQSEIPPYDRKEWMKPILDACLEKKSLKEMSNNIAIGVNAGALMTNNKCDILIGDNVTTPDNHPDYFLNIDNKICMDLLTRKPLKCPPLLPVGKNQ